MLCIEPETREIKDSSQRNLQQNQQMNLVPACVQTLPRLHYFNQLYNNAIHLNCQECMHAILIRNYYE